MQLVATADLRYASRELKAGESFAATDKDAEVLTRTGKASFAEGEKSPIEPEDDGSADASNIGRRPRYNRRDMRAKD